jgi:hypothetical protein
MGAAGKMSWVTVTTAVPVVQVVEICSGVCLE